LKEKQTKQRGKFYENGIEIPNGIESPDDGFRDIFRKVEDAAKAYSAS